MKCVKVKAKNTDTFMACDENPLWTQLNGEI